MTPDETCDLLALIAGFDQRTVGEADIEIWHDIATECGWTFPLAKRAVIEHHKRGSDKRRITPAHITDAIDAARALIRRQVFSRDLVPPKDLGDNPRAELDWRRRHIAAVTERALNAWANGEQLPAIEAPAEQDQPTRNVGTLIGGAFRMPRKEAAS
jgi:hypothetical protein